MPHVHELIDFTIGAYIVFEDRVLLVNHPRYNKWLAPGGHIELDEDPDEALFREITEETGLKDVEILSSKPEIKDPLRKYLYTPNFMEIHEANAPHKHIMLVYFARAKNNAHVQSNEHTEAKWFSLSELEDAKYNIAEGVKFYCQKALKAAKNT